MAGYNGYSMSNNAVDAYGNGQMPLSKWTKTEILNAIADNDYDVNKFKKIKLALLKEYFLKYSSWHHTSCRYNCTDFYRVDFDNVERYLRGCLELVEEEKEEKDKNVKEMIEIKYPVWGGSKKWPRITGYETMTGARKGDWCVGRFSRKKISGNGVTILREWAELEQ